MPKMRILFIYLVFLGFVFGQTGYEIAKKLDENINIPRQKCSEVFSPTKCSQTKDVFEAFLLFIADKCWFSKTCPNF